ncbi:ORF6N domain-containing protein [Candidatus Thiodiazotropha sp. LNASS1]|uniref:ORF6N domain-containing protein n=1 Tax=Candidatus Thiodiazotropha sp. LNASS1 TaxID=3096260 RepID=UPI0034DFB07F
MNKSQTIIPIERIAEKIYLIRGTKVMLDADLAVLYGVETRVLVQAVKRNIERFPQHFMFQLDKEEYDFLRSQIVTLNPAGRGQHRKYLPYVFTEQGVAMLSAVLRSKQAVQVSIAIMDTFVRLREILATHKDLARKVEEHDKHISNLYAHVERLLTPPKNRKKPIGFIWPEDVDDTQ